MGADLATPLRPLTTATAERVPGANLKVPNDMTAPGVATREAIGFPSTTRTAVPVSSVESI